ncbi:MAG: DNA repair protein RadC [Dehalogenimonas sp.]|jgi:DNA repair protein RadC|uniref:DNA repair protein RadC n=1 Tax=Candidatus Dehalogenimonas loeffleri TaxID=3127115 RepID=A0ABZ2J5N8_9CHLR|nr:DNA repair protein RadC [Dehalogenimonas sp.]
MPENTANQEHPSAGHRERLRQRFDKGGLIALADYEAVELLLTLGTPRRDCKPAAKAAIKRFKTFRGVLEATSEELQEIKGIGPANSVAIRLVAEAAREFLKEKAKAQDWPESCVTPRQVFDYLYSSMSGLKKEVFKVLYLNSQNRILDIAEMSRGTVNASVVWVREVVEQALRLGAAAMIFVHNHPSGVPSPSQQDRDITRDLVFAAATMNIRSLDHIIIGDNCYHSLASEGLLDKYKTEFQQLRENSR